MRTWDNTPVIDSFFDPNVVAKRIEEAANATVK
jgi:hypothetical protein